MALLFVFEFLNWSRILPYGTYFTWRGLLITTLVVAFLLEIINKLVQRRTGQALPAWIYLAVPFQLYFDALGDFFYLYRDYTWYDQVAHYLGGLNLAFIIWVFLRQLKIKIGLKGLLLFVLALAALASTLYEIEEYSEDLIFHSNRLGNAFDTVNDQLMGLLGALTFCAVTYIRSLFKMAKNKQPNQR